MATLDIRGTVVGETAVAIKAPCLVATTGANITLAGVQAIDGVTIGSNSERVLVKDQTTPSQNGVYIAANGNWVPAADWTGNNNVVTGTLVLVAGGKVNAGILFAQTCTDNPIVIGTSNIAFVDELSLTGLSQTATSTSSLTIGTASKTLGIQANKNFAVGQWVLIQETSNPANQMLGQITSYSATTLVVNVVATGGSGSHSDWTIVLTNSLAAAGYQPPTGTGNVTGPGSATSGHLATFGDATGKLIADGGAAGSIANLSSLSAQYLAASAVAFGINMLNGTIVASVNAGALKFAIKTLAGADPSSTDPVWFIFRDPTPALGDYSVMEVTAALSTTVPFNSKLGTLDGTPARVWVTAFNNGGTVSLAVINCLSGGNVYPLGGWGIATVTAYGTGANNAQTFYGAAGLSSLACSVLGYGSYESGSTLGTAGNWSAVPTRLELLRPGVLLPGAVVQALYNSSSAYSTSANNYSPGVSAPTISGGALVVSQAVTPSSSANLLRIKGEAVLGVSGAAVSNLSAFITQDAGTTALSTGAGYSSATPAPSKVSVVYQAPANTLASTTFKLYGASHNSTLNINAAGGGGTAYYGGTANSFIFVEEIMA